MATTNDHSTKTQNGNGSSAHKKRHDEPSAKEHAAEVEIEQSTEASNSGTPATGQGKGKAAAVVYTKEHIQGYSKARDGYEKHTEGMLGFYAANPEELGTSIKPDEIRTAQVKSVECANAEVYHEEQRQQAIGGRMENVSVVWKAMLAIYKKGLASDSLKNHPTLVAFERFMKNGPHATEEDSSDKGDTGGTGDKGGTGGTGDKGGTNGAK